jgi:uncharacterized protein (TIGR03067 family)
MRPRTFVASVALLLFPTAAPHAADRDQTTRVALLVRQLGDDSYSRREAASKALDALGAPALPALHQAAASADPEVRRRAARLVTRAQLQALTRDRAKLEGLWVVESETDDGKTTTPARDAGITFRFQRAGESCAITYRQGLSSQALACTWEIVEATATPPKIDLVFSAERRYRAVYRLDGDRLTLCGVDRSRGESDRPAKFESKEGDGRYLIRLKRAKGPAKQDNRLFTGFVR